MTQELSGHFSSLGLVFFVLKGLFTRREGTPRARVALARGLPLHSHISSFFTRRVYKAGRVTLALG